MENYLVRIARGLPEHPEQISGVIESIEKESEIAFSSLDALCRILADRDAFPAVSGNTNAAVDLVD